MGLNVLGYQSHVLQSCHPTSGHEASFYLTFSVTEAKIKRPGFVKNRTLDSALVISEVAIITIDQIGQKNGSCMCSNFMMWILFSSSLKHHMEGR